MMGFSINNYRTIHYVISVVQFVVFCKKEAPFPFITSYVNSNSTIIATCSRSIVVAYLSSLFMFPCNCYEKNKFTA
ncbi:hypothetical protein DOY81_005819 [Sarcophaga bullata]|nr:hypothetical protein DOY81_005819 [Sarcophaga bullata]